MNSRAKAPTSRARKAHLQRALAAAKMAERLQELEKTNAELNDECDKLTDENEDLVETVKKIEDEKKSLEGDAKQLAELKSLGISAFYDALNEPLLEQRCQCCDQPQQRKVEFVTWDARKLHRYATDWYGYCLPCYRMLEAVVLNHRRVYARFGLSLSAEPSPAASPDAPR